MPLCPPQRDTDGFRQNLSGRLYRNLSRRTASPKGMIPKDRLTPQNRRPREKEKKLGEGESGRFQKKKKRKERRARRTTLRRNIRAFKSSHRLPLLSANVDIPFNSKERINSLNLPYPTFLHPFSHIIPIPIPENSSQLTHNVYLILFQNTTMNSLHFRVFVPLILLLHGPTAVWTWLLPQPIENTWVTLSKALRQDNFCLRTDSPQDPL